MAYYLSLDGVNDWVDLNTANDARYDVTDEITMEVLINGHNFLGGGNRTIAYRAAGTHSTQRSYGLSVNGNQLQVTFSDGSVLTGVNLYDGTWYKVRAELKSGVSCKVWVDDVLVYDQPTTYTLISKPQSPILLGRVGTLPGFIGTTYGAIDYKYVKFERQGTVLGNYDFTSGSLKDTSGTEISAVNHYGSWVSDSGQDLPKTPKYYLDMDGVNDNLKTPSITFDKVVMDFSYEPKTATWQYFVDARTGVANQYLAVNDTLSGGTWTSIKADGVVIADATGIPKNRRTTIELVGTLGTDDVTLFSQYSGSANVKGKIYSAKFYNGATLVAHYDFTTGDALDQSGNNYHATLTGGTWKELDIKNRYLSMDGVDDNVVLPSMTYTRMVVDFKPNRTSGNEYYFSHEGVSFYSTDTADYFQNPAEYEGFYVNGVKATNNTRFITNNVRQTLDVRRLAEKTTSVTWFSRGDSFGVLAGELYSIKIYNGTTLVAHYDPSQQEPGQTLYDLSGNFNHATLTGGTWTEIPKYYLSMDGVDDYGKTPSITFDTIEMDMRVERQTDKDRWYFDTRAAFPITFGYVYSRTAGTDAEGNSSNMTSYVDGVLWDGTPTAIIPNNTRTTLKTVFNQVGTTTAHIFSANGGGSQQKGRIYSVKFYNGSTLVAHYDMTQGDQLAGKVYDISGNANHATLTGGTWTLDEATPTPTIVEGSATLTAASTLSSSGSAVNAGSATLTAAAGLSAAGDVIAPPAAGYYLQMDGVDDFIKTPSITFNEVIIDFSSVFVLSRYVLDARTGISNGILYWSNTNRIRSNFNQWYLDGVRVTTEDTPLADNQRVTIRMVNTTSGTDDVNLFSTNNGFGSLAGNLYSVKFINNGTLAAHYDPSQQAPSQTLTDLSGNGNHATLTGGTWVEDTGNQAPTIVEGTAVLSAVMTFGPSALNLKTSQMGFISQGQLTALGSVIAKGEATLNGSAATLHSESGMILQGTAHLSASSVGDMTGIKIVSATASASSSASMTKTPTRIRSGTATVTGRASAQSIPGGNREGTAHLQASSTLTPQATYQTSGTAHLRGSCAIWHVDADGPKKRKKGWLFGVVE